MAAPLVAAALKAAAKNLGAAAISKARNGGGSGGGFTSKTQMTLIAIAVIAILFLSAVGYGLASVVSAHIPKSEITCELPMTRDIGDSDPANTVPGTADGSLGSNIPYPETDTESIVWPLPQSQVSSGFGYRTVPPGTSDFFGTGSYFHNGLDFGSAMGTPIVAAADGIVAQSAPNNEGYGYGTVVTIHHLVNGKKMNTTYGHVRPDSLKFKVGDTVKAGQVVAGVGSEGNSTGPHLHFVVTEGIYTIQSEINRGPANNIDPAQWLASNGAKQTTPSLDGSGSPVEGVPAGQGELCSDKSTADGTITAWGGYSNGQIPENELQALSFAPQFRLAKGAALKVESLNAAFKIQFNKDLPIVSAYKDVAAQGGGSGTDIAGWAKSIELDKSITFSSPEYSWLGENGPNHSFMNPIVNRKNGSSPLATRWVFIGAGENEAELPGTLNDYQKYASERLHTVGFSSSGEMACLVKLWERESNWRVDADNPSSDAYGIPQALPGSKMSTHGADWATSYKTQINWGIDYIKGRYGTPCSALSHSDRVGWY